MKITVIIYALSCFLNWLYFYLAYGKNGTLPSEKAENVDLILAFFPAFNTIFCVIAWGLHFPLKTKYMDNLANWVFRVK